MIEHLGYEVVDRHFKTIFCLKAGRFFLSFRYSLYLRLFLIGFLVIL